MPGFLEINLWSYDPITLGMVLRASIVAEAWWSRAAQLVVARKQRQTDRQTERWAYISIRPLL